MITSEQFDSMFKFTVGCIVQHKAAEAAGAHMPALVVCRELVDDGKALWPYYSIRAAGRNELSLQLLRFSEEELTSVVV